MKWILVTIIACCYGFFRDFRPSEAYLTQYLTSEWKNLTLDQVNSDIYPWWTYSYVVWLIPIFLLTDYYRYKPMLILDAFVYILTWCLLVWAKGIPAMTCMQVLYGLASAAEVGYYSYLYAMVEKKHFRKVTSIVRCTTLFSKFVAYLVGQLFVSFEVTNLRSLNIIAFSCVCLAFCIALLLPKANSSELFNKKKALTVEEDENKTNVFEIGSKEPPCESDDPSSNENATFSHNIYKNTNKDQYKNVIHSKGINETVNRLNASESTSIYTQLSESANARNEQDAHIPYYELEFIAASSRRIVNGRQTKYIHEDHTNVIRNLTEDVRREFAKEEIDKDRKDKRNDRIAGLYDSEKTAIDLFNKKNNFNPLHRIEHKDSYSDKPDYRDNDISLKHSNDESVVETLKSGFQFVLKEIRYSYSSRTVTIWSLWWIFASYGNFQTGSYIQDLWKVIRDANGYTQSYNGAVEAAGMLLGSICVGLVCFVPVKWSSPGRCEILMTTVCALKATIYVVMSSTNFIWVAYVLYDCLRVLNQVSITVESAEIAKALPGPRYGFVFGCNMFLALVIESVFTAIVVDNAGFGVHVRTQFLVYGIYSFAMALVFAVVAVITIWRHIHRRKSTIDDEDITKDTVNCDTNNSDFITHL